MEIKDKNYSYQSVFQVDEATQSRKFLANVFLWMFAALAISSFFAYEFATNDVLKGYIVNPERGLTGLGLIAIFSPIAFVMLINFGLQRIAFPVLVILFVAYATLMGISLSFVLWAYTASSVLSVFIAATVLFGVMAVAGYVTSTDLTKFGSLLFIGVIGLFISYLLNAFLLHSSSFDYVLSFLGVAIFTGLTAYKVQDLKNTGAAISGTDANANKLALAGALSLYITFVNLFMSLLRIFGSRK